MTKFKTVALLFLFGISIHGVMCFGAANGYERCGDTDAQVLSYLEERSTFEWQSTAAGGIGAASGTTCVSSALATCAEVGLTCVSSWSTIALGVGGGVAAAGCGCFMIYRIAKWFTGKDARHDLDEKILLVRTAIDFSQSKITEIEFIEFLSAHFETPDGGWGFANELATKIEDAFKAGYFAPLEAYVKEIAADDGEVPKIENYLTDRSFVGTFFKKNAEDCLKDMLATDPKIFAGHRDSFGTGLKLYLDAIDAVPCLCEGKDSPELTQVGIIYN